MNALEPIAVEYLIDCTQPMLCDCEACDLARRARVAAFAARWMATHMQDEASGVRTVRPPRMTSALPVRSAKATESAA